MGWSGFVVFCAASAGAFAWGRRGATPRRAGVWLGCLLVSVLLRYQPMLEARWLANDLYAHVRPWSSVVLALAFIGSALPQLPERRKRVALGALAAVLFALVAERAAASASFSPRDLTGVPDGVTGVCPQTTGHTCGPAAAATLLAQVGLAATEAEMARRCLTNCFSGTSEVGLLKGLEERLAGSGWRAELRAVPADGIADEHLPALASTRLSLTMGHWVVVLAREGDRLRIADPLRVDTSPQGGLLLVPVESFAETYDGRLLMLVPRAR